MDRNAWDLATLAAEVTKIFSLPRSETPENWRQMAPAQLADHLVELAGQEYDAKESTLGPEMMRQLERLLMLRAVDNRWVRHLTIWTSYVRASGCEPTANRTPGGLQARGA